MRRRVQSPVSRPQYGFVPVIAMSVHIPAEWPDRARHRDRVQHHVLGIGVARGEERVCRGSLGAITVDNLRVPQGATCTLQDTRVQAR
jgi:hypothetical protein